MRLTDLEPKFFRYEEGYVSYPWIAPAGGNIGDVHWSETYPRVYTLIEAQALSIICPKCGGHRVMITFADKGVPDHLGTRSKDGRPTRWQVSGTGFEDLTLSPSVDCTPSNPNCWHGLIQNGEVTGV